MVAWLGPRACVSPSRRRHAGPEFVPHSAMALSARAPPKMATQASSNTADNGCRFPRAWRPSGI